MEQITYEQGFELTNQVAFPPEKKKERLYYFKGIEEPEIRFTLQEADLIYFPVHLKGIDLHLNVFRSEFLEFEKMKENSIEYNDEKS